MPSNTIHSDLFNNHEINDDVNLDFEVRAERLPPPTDTQSTS
jgi:hypothetical protein